MRAAGEARKCAVVLAEAPTTGSCKLAAVFCAVVRSAAFPVVHTHTHTHTHTQLSPRLISSIKLASQAESEAKRPCTDWHGISPHFSPSASNIFPFFFFLPLTQFLCAVFVCMQGFVFLDFLENVYVFIGLTTYCTFCQGNWLITVKINRQLEK